MTCRALLPLFIAAVTAVAQQPSDNFYQAIRNNDLSSLRSLVKTHGANLADSRGQTPLMFAAAYGSATAFKFLVDAGADAKATSEFGITPLHWAAGDPQKTRLLLARNADVNVESQIKRTPLLIAAATHGASASVKALLERGARVNVADAQGTTPLIAAATVNDLESVKLLLDKGAEVNARPTTGWTPLMNAASNGNADMVRLLLAHEADVNAVSADSNGSVKNGPLGLGFMTPLHWASISRRSDVVRMLLDAGAKVDLQDVRGMTPLMSAVSTDRADPVIVRLLLEKGSNPTIRSKAGETTLDWARKFNHPEILALLKLTPEPTTSAAAKPVVDTMRTPKQAAEAGLATLQRATDYVFKDSGCIACHAQPITEIAAQSVRARGWRVDEVLSKQSLASMTANSANLSQPVLQGRETGGLLDGTVYALLALDKNGAAGTPGTDAAIAFLAKKQRSSGNWQGYGATRAPIQDGDFTRTALAIRALVKLGIPGRKEEFDQRVARAAKWLAAGTPDTTEQRAMQLLGLHWAKSEANLRATRMRELLALQRADGGWAQTPYLETDAYATGQVLYALHELGVSPGDMAFRHGVDFLLRTQAADGTWHVKNRAMKFQPYFESGFPYEHDQWISAMATGWAVLGLSYSEASPASVAVR